jgi:hypothetical protein
MEVTVKIETCDDCRHRDHTGGFTPGGAKPCCHHPVTVAFNDGHKVIPYKNEYPDNRNVFHKHTFNTEMKPIRIPKGIPDWCALKRGEKY